MHARGLSLYRQVGIGASSPLGPVAGDVDVWLLREISENIRPTIIANDDASSTQMTRHPTLVAEGNTQEKIWKRTQS
jgi:hypothetical protein